MIVATVITIYIAMVVFVNLIPPLIISVESAKNTPGIPNGLGTLLDATIHCIDLDRLILMALLAITGVAVIWIGGQS